MRMHIIGFTDVKDHRSASLALRIAGAGLALVLLSGGSMQACAPFPNSPRGQMHGSGWGWDGQMGPTDQHFLAMMVLHHEDAIAMADLALIRAQRSEVKTLARSIKINQSREIEQMRRWYRQWFGTDLQRWARGRHMGMGWQDNRMMGVNMQALRQAVDFDRAFIEQMIPHHQMGVMMSSMTANNTKRPEIRKLADEISREQGKEIRLMEGWYRKWYP